MMRYYALLLCSIILTSLVLILLKKVSIDAKGAVSEILLDIRFYGAVVAYGIAFLMWVISASKVDYSMLIFSNALGLVIGGLAGYFIFGESITKEKIVAYSLILCGVFVIFFSLIRLRMLD